MYSIWKLYVLKYFFRTEYVEKGDTIVLLGEQLLNIDRCDTFRFLTYDYSFLVTLSKAAQESVGYRGNS